MKKTVHRAHALAGQHLACWKQGYYVKLRVVLLRTSITERGQLQGVTLISNFTIVAQLICNKVNEMKHVDEITRNRTQI